MRARLLQLTLKNSRKKVSPPEADGEKSVDERVKCVVQQESENKNEREGKRGRDDAARKVKL